MRLREPEKVLNLIPKAKQVRVKGKDYVAAPHCMKTTRALRYVGIDAPAPIRYYYCLLYTSDAADED